MHLAKQRSTPPLIPPYGQSILHSGKEYRSSTPNGDTFSRLKSTENNSMPPRRENISESNKVLLMVCPGRQLERIEIRIRYSKILSLTTTIRSHRHIPIGTSRKPRIHMCTESTVTFILP